MSTVQSEQTVISAIGREHLRLHLTPDVGPIRLRSLLTHFGSLATIRGASQAELMRVDGIGPKTSEAIFRARAHDAPDREIERAEKCGVRILCSEDEEYPRPLLSMNDPPTCLYVRGKIEPTDAVAISIVGTRKCSQYGLEQSTRFAELLAAAGFTIVSGLARGIDAAAHRGALRGLGRTIAVLGNGLSTIYPSEHADLAARIVEGGTGAVVSELPIDAGPEAKNFPGRNRIIAGLSLGVIVVEAGQRSGALITAHLALDYNREVFAVPGRVDMPDLSAGTNGLIRDSKAKLITCLEDVLEGLGDVGRIMDPKRPLAAAPVNADAVEAAATLFDSPSSQEASPPSAAPGAVLVRDSHLAPAASLAPHEQSIFDAIASGIELGDAIQEATALPMARVNATLTGLQLKGLVRQLPGNRFVLRSRAS